MKTEKVISAEEMKSIKIKIHEPFAEFLSATDDEVNFELSLLDVVRFAGHACPSMVGAFMVSQHAVAQLFPENNVCERGDVSIELATGPEEGASGPISNVFSYIFGAWEKSGFGGLGGEKFVRRNLLKYNSPDIPRGVFRFRRLSTGKVVDVSYEPKKAQVNLQDEWPFQIQWRTRIARVAQYPEEVITSIVK